MNKTPSSRKTDRPREGSVTLVIIILLAVGAATLVCTWLYNAMNRALTWERPQLAQLAVRGDGGQQKEPAYKPEDMMGFFSSLQSTIEQEYGKQVTPAGKKSWFGPKKTQWTMRIRMQELIDGSLVIQVEADNRENNAVKKEWILKCASADDFKSRVGTFSGQVAEEMAPAKDGATTHL